MDRTIRVVTWNVWGTYGDWERRQDAIEQTLRQVAPDVLALQEAWQRAEGTQADHLKKTLDLSHAEELPPGSTASCSDALALLSRWPITDRFSVCLPALGRDGADRWVLGGTVAHPAGAFRVVVTHLSWRIDDGWLRRAQVEAIVDQLAARPRSDGPTVLVGDLNAPPDADEIRLLTGKLATGDRRIVFRDAWEAAGSGPGHTWSPDNPHAAPEHDPPARLDYVMVEWRPDEPGRVRGVALVGTEPAGGTFPSDHFGVAVDLDVGVIA